MPLQLKHYQAAYYKILQRLYAKIIALSKQFSGKLNFHDALIALKCQELQLEALLSFDSDFDAPPWIKRSA